MLSMFINGSQGGSNTTSSHPFAIDVMKKKSMFINNNKNVTSIVH